MIDPTLQRSLTLCAGKSGSGKTTFALLLLVNQPEVACRFIFDPDGQLARRLNLPHAETPNELDDDCETGWVVFSPHKMFPGKLPAAFEFFCAWAFAAAERMPGRKILLVDEVWKYCAPTSIPQSLADCVQTGRVRGLDLVFCTQRPNRLNGAITNEVSEFVCFRLQDEPAVKKAVEFGHDESEIRSLAPYEFVSLTDGGERMRAKTSK